MMVAGLVAVAALAGVSQAERLDIRPIEAPEKGRYGLLGFEIRAAWMDGFLQMRTPETLTSSMGLHFIDHDRPDMRPLSWLRPWPKWSRDDRTGALTYAVRTAEGVEFRARAVPGRGRIEMEFRVRNRSSTRVRNVGNQMCLVMTGSGDFGDRNTLARTWVFRDGRPFDLTSATPTPKDKGREPWVLMLTTAGVKGYGGPRDYADGWWVVDQVADVPLIARTSADGRHLVAISWDGGPLYVMTNARIPCLHAGPTNVYDLEPGKECVWRGAIWLMANDPRRLREAYERGWGRGGQR